MFNCGYFTMRQGFRVPVRFTSRSQAVERLRFLERDEELTRRVRPTDSGDVRFNYNAEADCIRKALGIIS